MVAKMTFLKYKWDDVASLNKTLYWLNLRLKSIFLTTACRAISFNPCLLSDLISYHSLPSVLSLYCTGHLIFHQRQQICSLKIITIAVSSTWNTHIPEYSLNSCLISCWWRDLYWPLQSKKACPSPTQHPQWSPHHALVLTTTWNAKFSFLPCILTTLHPQPSLECKFNKGRTFSGSSTALSLVLGYSSTQYLSDWIN